MCGGVALVGNLIIFLDSKGKVRSNRTNQKKTRVVSEKRAAEEKLQREIQKTGKRALKIGERGILWNDHAIKKHPNIVPFCVDKETMNAMYDALCAGDEVGFLDLWLSDRLLNPFAGTRVLVIKRDFALSKVRILEGTHAGRAGWVPYEWVVKEGR